jgi:hypothetical protein
MKTICTVAAVLCAISFGAAHAAETTKKPTTQQQRMKDCNKDATGKKGDERKAFMSSCLKGEAAPTVGANSQQNKMKACNAKAADKKGDERKQFMSSCLKS